MSNMQYDDIIILISITVYNIIKNTSIWIIVVI